MVTKATWRGRGVFRRQSILLQQKQKPRGPGPSAYHHLCHVLSYHPHALEMFLSHLLILCVCMCTQGHACVESESNLQDLVLSSHHVVPTQVINFGSKRLYQLRAISMALNCFFFFFGFGFFWNSLCRPSWPQTQRSRVLGLLKA